jgi:hypothetical protein
MANEVRKFVIGLASIGLSMICSTALKADIVSGATSRAGFNDTALWAGTCQQDLPSATSTSTNGVGVTATDATGGIDTDTQDPPGCSYDGWNGNFAPGDNLLYTGTAFGTGSGPITLTLSSPVSGIGTQFMTDFYGSFTAQIAIYNGATLLGSFTEDGTANGDADNSAIFLGAVDSTGADITSAVLSVVGTGDFTINDVSLVDSPVPEPASLVLFATLLGLAGAAARLRRKRLT